MAPNKGQHNRQMQKNRIWLDSLHCVSLACVAGVKLLGSIVLKSLLILLFCSALSGCSSSIYIYLFNNTNSPIQAFGMEEDVLVAAGENIYIEVVNSFKLCIKNKAYEYSSQENLPPGKYYGTEHFPKHSVHFQVETSGALYLAMPDTQLPIKVASQPEGFPVLPKEAGRCEI